MQFFGLMNIPELMQVLHMILKLQVEIQIKMLTAMIMEILQIYNIDFILTGAGPLG
jgi:hypothetical protein